MTVYKNIAFGLTIRKTSKSVIRSRVEKALRLVDLEGFEDRLPKQLSGGQQQRVAIARTIVRNPHVLLFDEPLSNLDPKLRVPLRTELKQLHRRIGSTALYVTHDQTEAMVLGDRIAVMRDGCLIWHHRKEIVKIPVQLIIDNKSKLIVLQVVDCPMFVRRIEDGPAAAAVVFHNRQFKDFVPFKIGTSGGTIMNGEGTGRVIKDDFKVAVGFQRKLNVGVRAHRRHPHIVHPPDAGVLGDRYLAA